MMKNANKQLNKLENKEDERKVTVDRKRTKEEINKAQYSVLHVVLFLLFPVAVRTGNKSFD